MGACGGSNRFAQGIRQNYRCQFVAPDRLQTLCERVKSQALHYDQAVEPVANIGRK